MTQDRGGRPGMMVYFDWLPMIEQMTPEQAKVFLLASMRYAKDGTQPEFQDAGLCLVWPMTQARLDADAMRYAKISAANAKKRQYSNYRTKSSAAGQDYLSFEEWCAATEDS